MASGETMQRADVSRLQNDKIDFLDQVMLDQQKGQEKVKSDMQNEYDVNLSSSKMPRQMSPRYLQSDLLQKFGRILGDAAPNDDTTNFSQQSHILLNSQKTSV